MNMQELKDKYISILRTNVKRDGVNELIEYLDNSGFFYAPASTKYHGDFSGGLCWHSLNVYYDLIDELNLLYGKDWHTVYSLESVTIVSLLHDLCKIDKYVESTKNIKNNDTGEWEQVNCYEYNKDQPRLGHGSSSLYIISDFIKLTQEEKQAIHWHMGPFDVSQYNSTYDMGNAFNNNTLAFALHIADMTATYVDENDKFNAVQNTGVKIESIDNENIIVVKIPIEFYEVNSKQSVLSVISAIKETLRNRNVIFVPSSVEVISKMPNEIKCEIRTILNMIDSDIV